MGSEDLRVTEALFIFACSFLRSTADEEDGMSSEEDKDRSGDVVWEA